MARSRSSPYANGTRSSPRDSPKGRYDSPSRQLHTDLERTLTNIRLHDQESQKLYHYYRKTVQDDLDAKEHAQAVVHNAVIDEALAKHEIVRQQAVAVLEAHIKEEEERRRRDAEAQAQREAEERRRVEEDRRANEERSRKAQEVEAARKAAEERAKTEREERARQQREETLRRENEAKAKAEADAAVAATKRAEDNARKAAEAAAAERQSVTKAVAADDIKQSSSFDAEMRHKHYLSIHQRLKTFRTTFWDAAKKNSHLKPMVGDMRRAIKTAVGQLNTLDKSVNKAATDKVQNLLLTALRDTHSAAVPLNDWLPSHLQLNDNNETTIPALLLYLINIFSKSIISSFATEASSNPLAADPVGTLAVQIFSMTELQFKRNSPAANTNSTTDSVVPTSVSLISILLAKYHASCAPLFGVSGPESTSAGRSRLGWRKADGMHIPAKAQYARTIGLAAGYAAISLRNFTKTKRTSPYPPIRFWESLSYLLNTPPQEVQMTHILLIKHLLDTGYDRFVQFYGADAVAVLRHAVVEFPKTLVEPLARTPEVQTLKMMAQKWREKENFSII